MLNTNRTFKRKLGVKNESLFLIEKASNRQRTFSVMPLISAHAFYSIAFVESSIKSVCSENHLKLL